MREAKRKDDQMTSKRDRPMAKSMRLRIESFQAVATARGPASMWNDGGAIARAARPASARAARSGVRPRAPPRPGRRCPGARLAVSMARYQPPCPAGSGARVNSASFSAALNMMRMSLSSRSASISDLLPSIRRASVRRSGSQSAGSRRLGEPGDIGDRVVAESLPL